MMLAVAAVLMFTLSSSAQDHRERQSSMNPRPGKFISQKMPCKLLKGISERDYSIYLPGSYEEDALKQYPVLYLLHGGGGAHTDYERYHKISHIADSLIDCGAIDDVIIVTPEGNQQHMMYFNTTEGKAGAPDWQYEDYFFNELIPYIEKTYRVRTDKGGRAIAGFSMGGGAATVYGLHRPEMFSMVYDISGYLRRQPLDFLKNDASAEWRQQTIADNDPVTRISNASDTEVANWKKVDWKICVGDHDFTLGGNLDLAKAFRGKGINFSMYVNDGRHDGKWVQPALEDVLKRADKNFESLWIKNGDRTIYGIISKPRYHGEKQPVAIIAHGFNGTHAYARTYFETLNALGYQVYAFDFPCGSVYSRSDDNTLNMSILDEQSDLEAVVHYFQRQPDIDPDKIMLIGESQGGFVSTLVASHIPQDIDAMVLVFPALCIPDNWRARYPTLSDIPEVTNLWNVPMGRRFFEEIHDMNAFKNMGKFKKPVLIIQGDVDPVVSMDDSRRAARTYKNASLHIIPGAGHGFKPEEQRQSLQQIRQMIEKMKILGREKAVVRK